MTTKGYENEHGHHVIAIPTDPPVRGPKAPPRSDSVPARLSEGLAILDHNALLKFVQDIQSDETWKLKLRILKAQFKERRDLHAENGDGLVASGLMMAMNYVDDMLGPEDDDD